MYVGDLAKVLQHSSFLAAVLAGFSVTLFATLLSVSPKHKIVQYAAGAALIAAALLGIASFAAVSGMVGAILDQDAALGPGHQSTILGAFQWTMYSFLAGMVAFFASLGISGWIYSKRFGIVSTAISAITVLALAYFLVAVAQAF